MRSLVVEDDFVSRRLLQRILSSFGEADVAIDGQEALEVFASAHADNEPYHVICLDINMPNLNGHETLKAIRGLEEEMGLDPEMEDGAKVIMTTGLRDKESVLTAFRAGCEAYLQKPFSREELVAKLVDLGFDLGQ